MMSSYKISVLMPVKNGEDYIDEAILSILNQSFVCFELIIIDDNSSDNTEMICKLHSKNDSRVKYYRSTGNGIVDALNYGIKKSSSKYIARMDADDISHKDRLLKQFIFMEDNLDCAVVGTAMELFEWDNSNKEASNIEHVNFPTKHSVIKSYLKQVGKFWILSHPTVMMRKSVLNDVGLYNDNYHSTEDLDLWVRLVLKGYKLRNLTECLLSYRISSTNVTSNNKVHRYLNTAILINQIKTGTRVERNDIFPAEVSNLRKYTSPSNFIYLLADFIILLRGTTTEERKDTYRIILELFSNEIIKGSSVIMDKVQDSRSWPKSMSLSMKQSAIDDINNYILKEYELGEAICPK